MDLLALYAQATPDKPALIDDRREGTRQLTFAELDAATNRLANVLVERGVGVGDKVAWCGQNSIGVVVLICGGAAARVDGGARQLSLHRRRGRLRDRPQRRHRRVRRRRAGPDARPHPRRHPGSPLGARVRRPVPRHPTTGGSSPPTTSPRRRRDTAPQLGDEPPATAAMMIYTSGTTGKPKGAVRTIAPPDPRAVGAFVALVGYTTDDVYITTGPLYHSGPLGFMTPRLRARADGRRAAQVRRRGLAAARRDVPLHVDVLRADADADDLQPPRRRARSATTARRCGS